MARRVTLWTLCFVWLALSGWAFSQRERVLVQRRSPFGELQVTQLGRQRMLKMRQGHAFVEQSRCDLDHPDRLVHEYSRMQLVGTLFPRQLRRVLVIGLGGASLTRAVLACYPDVQVDSIELDPVIVALARRYFFYREGPRAQTVTGDARAWLQESTQLYDAIVLDAFDGLEIPAPLRTRQFYELVRAHLQPGGAALANLHRSSRTYSRDRATLASVFPQTPGFPGLGVTMVVASAEPLTAQTERWSDRAGFTPDSFLKLFGSERDWDADALPFSD